MDLGIRYAPYRLVFRQKAITSREEMTYKDTYIIQVWDKRNPEVKGTGEIAIFKGLSGEDVPQFPVLMKQVLQKYAAGQSVEVPFSSVRFGLETACASLANGGNFIVYPSDFTSGGFCLPINGLIWMGSFGEMKERMEEKIRQGFSCIKLKIGGINITDEIELLRWLRSKYSDVDLTVRLDANGSLGRYSYDVAMKTMERLAKYRIHSIEQPFPPSHEESTCKACAERIIPIALDEQLIGITPDKKKNDILEYLRPQYIILKPSLCGGFLEAKKWIDASEEKNIGWWVTSALESAIGLNAIAQWTAGLGVATPQGLGTGELYRNDLLSPLRRCGEWLSYDGSLSEGWIIPDNLDWIYV